MTSQHVPATVPSRRAVDARTATSRRRFLLGAVSTLATVTAAACGPARSGGVGVSGPGDGKTTGDSQPGAAFGSPPGRLLYVGDANVWLWEKSNARRLTNDRI